MADSKSYQKFPEVTIFFGQACENETKATDALADALNLAEVTADKWPEDILGAWTSGLKPLMESIQPNSTLAPELRRLLQALLDCGVESPEIREAFVALFRNLNPRCANPQGYAEAIGFRNTEVPVRTLARRMRLCMAIQDGVCCYNSAFGGGVITAVDELNTEVKVQEERVRGVALKHFLDTMVIIRKDSVLEKLVRGQSVAAYASREAFEKEAVECLTGAVEVSATLVKSILVPGVMDEKAYSAIFDPAAASKAAEAAKPAAPPAGSAAYRWDNSRSIAELEGRLAAAESLKVDDDEVNHANVVNLLSRDCHRTDLADKWAACVAIIRKSDLFNQRLSQLLGELKERVAAWKDTDLFVTICDKMPGKLVPFWMACSYEAMGAAFLASTTVKMPFRLWIHTERLLNQNKEGALFGETVFQAFQQGSPSADHYVWLWKAPKSELRTKYLADSYMLFKTLHLDVRGNYLKSRREVHKLLMDSEPFQRALMNDGDETAVRNLIRCVNHLPLLEGNEKQSLLVKIVRIFPAMKGLVESAGASNSRAAGKTVPRLRLTSKRSYVRTRAEYDNLVNVQIPANTTAIETARAHGDLSENSEYKYAKEQQRFLNGRRASLEKELNTVKPFDFSEQQVEKIIIPGCVVTLHYLADGHEEVINLLGIFDGDSERSFYSYDSPMGRGLMTRSTGERITVPSGLEATIASVKPLPQDIIDELNNTDI